MTSNLHYPPIMFSTKALDIASENDRKHYESVRMIPSRESYLPAWCGCGIDQDGCQSSDNCSRPSKNIDRGSSHPEKPGRSIGRWCQAIEKRLGGGEEMAWQPCADSNEIYSTLPLRLLGRAPERVERALTFHSGHPHLRLDSTHTSMITATHRNTTT